MDIGILRKGLALFLSLALIISVFHLTAAQAGTLTDYQTALSNNYISSSNVSYTFSFTTLTTSPLQQINLRFQNDTNVLTKPAHQDLSNVALVSTSGLGANWAIDTGNSDLANGLVVIHRPTPDTVNSGVAATIVLSGITNPILGDCNPSPQALNDTCYVKLVTFSDTGTTSIDDGLSSYTIIEDPFLTFEVKGVAKNQSHNGITTTIDSTSTAIPFGTLQYNQPKYAAQEIHISTNAIHGYQVYAYLNSNFLGAYFGKKIDPFGALNATWSTPQTWSSPFGTTPGINTGWFGANTSDSRIAGWSSASGKFGPISEIPHVVAESTGADRAGSTIFVTYGIEISSYQTSDYYSGNLIYDVQATY
jgi:hypothetical protein